MSAVLFGLLAAIANAGQALISKELTTRAPARQLIGVLYLGNALVLLPFAPFVTWVWSPTIVGLQVVSVGAHGPDRDLRLGPARPRRGVGDDDRHGDEPDPGRPRRGGVAARVRSSPSRSWPRSSSSPACCWRSPTRSPGSTAGAGSWRIVGRGDRDRAC